MSNKRNKTYRKIAEKTMDKAKKQILKDNQQTIIFSYIERLCLSPFHTRLAYCWKFLLGKNPHTGKKVK